MQIDMVQVDSKSEQTSKRLMQYIIDNKLKPGDKLPSEDELSRLFDVSRVSIREATNGLKFLGMLDSAPRRGTTLASVNFNRLNQYIGYQIAFEGLPEEELLEARTVVEIGILESVSQRLNESTYNELRNLAAACRREDDSPEEVAKTIDYDLKFHSMLLEINGNFALMAFSRLLETFFRHLRKHPGTVADSERSAMRHLMITDALWNSNIELARGLMKEHLDIHKRI